MESTRNTMCYRIRDQELCCHSASVQGQETHEVEEHWECCQANHSAAEERHQIPQSSHIRGRISSSIISGNLWMGQPLTDPQYHCVTNLLNSGCSCFQKRVVWEDLGAILYKETQEGGGKFFLASAEQKLSDVKEHSAWRFILWCWLHCVYVLTATRCCIQVSSWISIASGHLEVQLVMPSTGWTNSFWRTGVQNQVCHVRN